MPDHWAINQFADFKKKKYPEGWGVAWRIILKVYSFDSDFDRHGWLHFKEEGFSTIVKLTFSVPLVEN